MTHPVCKDGENELPGLESVEDPFEDTQVRRERDVTLEADVRVLGLRRDVDRHVFALNFGLQSFFYIKSQSESFFHTFARF